MLTLGYPSIYLSYTENGLFIPTPYFMPINQLLITDKNLPPSYPVVTKFP